MACTVTPVLSEKNEHSNNLIITDDANGDNSIVLISQQKMDQLQLFRGDTVLLKGRKRRETICYVLPDDVCPNDCVKMNIVIRNNLRVRCGDVVSIEYCEQIKHCKHIRVAPINDSIYGVFDDLLKVYLKPYFDVKNRPVKEGDIFGINSSMGSVEFKVMKTEPAPYCIVTSYTDIVCDNDAIAREGDEGTHFNEIRYDHVGGLDSIKEALRKLIQFPLEYSSVLLSRGILLYGPPGCGKFEFTTKIHW